MSGRPEAEVVKTFDDFGARSLTRPATIRSYPGLLGIASCQVGAAHVKKNSRPETWSAATGPRANPGRFQHYRRRAWPSQTRERPSSWTQHNLEYALAVQGQGFRGSARKQMELGSNRLPSLRALIFGKTSQPDTPTCGNLGQPLPGAFDGQRKEFSPVNR